jgi:Flp pilus assembly protein TadG
MRAVGYPASELHLRLHFPAGCVVRRAFFNYLLCVCHIIFLYCGRVYRSEPVFGLPPAHAAHSLRLAPTGAAIQHSVFRSQVMSNVAARFGRGVTGWLRRGDRSAVSLELGIIAVPFFVMFLGTMEVSYDLFVQSELDNAVNIAARSVQVGNSQGAASEKSSKFVSSLVCPLISGALDCGLLTVGVGPVPSGSNYYTYPWQTVLTQSSATSGTGICTGTGGQMMILAAWYDGPTFLGLLVPYFSTQYNNTTVHLTTASAAFVNEWFVGGQQC